MNLYSAFSALLLRGYNCMRESVFFFFFFFFFFDSINVRLGVQNPM
jgi:hypothetical protein